MTSMASFTRLVLVLPVIYLVSGAYVERATTRSRINAGHHHHHYRAAHAAPLLQSKQLSSRRKPSFLLTRMVATGSSGVQAPKVDDDESPLQVSTLRSVTFCYLPKEEEPNLLCDFLLELGACSTSIVDSDLDTDMEEPLFSEPINDPWKDSLEWASPIWNRCNLTAHFPASTDLAWVLEMIADTWSDDADHPSYANLALDLVEDVPNKDWVVHVQKGWKPILVGSRFIITFPWHSNEDVQAVTISLSDTQREKLVHLQLQGGIAFGTGEHPTTQLCLQWIERTVQSALSTRVDGEAASVPLKILDYGAGSGVLGMAACAMAPSLVEAVGVDIDVDACQIANANAHANNQLAMKNYLPPLVETTDAVSKSLLLKAHTHAQKQLQGRAGSAATMESLILPPEKMDCLYDLCVANILAAPLVTLATTLASMIKPGGWLGMSGIWYQQEAMVIEAYQEAGFEDVKMEQQEGPWILITARRKDLASGDHA